MLALIAGRGALPGQVAAAQDTPPLVCALEGQPPDTLTPDITFSLETLGTLLVTLCERGVTEVCLAGAITRPALDPARLDAETAPLVPLLTQALQEGDDGALRAVLALFEKTGFTVRAAHDLAPYLIAPPGVLSARAPDAQIRRDADRGGDVLAALAPLDVGQACVVAMGQVLAIEAAGGTNWMLETLPDTGLGAYAVLVKGAKAGQDRRADLPTIGPDTVRAAAKAGLSAIVIAAGDVIVLDREETIGLCDARGLVLWAREPR